MYYSAITVGDKASQKVQEIADHCGIDIKLFPYDSTEGKVLMDNLLEFMILNAYDFPLVLAGYDVIGSGDNAWLDLYDHHAKNPHVHWEAGDGE